MRGRTGEGFVRFCDGAQVAYDVPLDTRDPRYLACSQHHPACDCREAELSEDLAEYSAQSNLMAKVLKAVLVNHPSCCCQCTGCQIARQVGMSGAGSGSCCVYDYE